MAVTNSSTAAKSAKSIESKSSGPQSPERSHASAPACADQYSLGSKIVLPVKYKTISGQRKIRVRDRLAAHDVVVTVFANQRRRPVRIDREPRRALVTDGH
jgi:hypothetical protein